MESTRRGPIWDVIKLGVEGVPADEFVRRARAAKTEVVAKALRMYHEILMLDQMVALIAPDEPWESGWTEEMVSRAKDEASSLPKTVRLMPLRATRTLEIADEMISSGSHTVTSKAIAEQLREEGYEGYLKYLAVSVGNILARSEDWIKVKPGEYAPIEQP